MKVEVTVNLSTEFAAILTKLVGERHGALNGHDERQASDRVTKRVRVRRGELDIYRGPYTRFAVVALDDLGGRAHRRDIFNRGKELLGNQLRPEDEKPISERKPYPRWRYRLGWALTIARHRGYMRPEGKKTGMWQLNPQGKRAADKYRRQIQSGTSDKSAE
jgi:hypothetical protein